MPTKTISTQKAAQVIDATHFLLVSPLPCRIIGIEGFVSGGVAGTQYFLQLLTVPNGTAVSGTTVPLRSLQVVGVNGFSFLYNTTPLDTSTMSYPSTGSGIAGTAGNNTSPIYLAISSTDTVWTAVAAATDASVDIDLPSVELPNLTQVANDGNGSQLTVWSDNAANTNKRLVNFIFNNAGYGTLVYAQLFSYVPTTGAVPSQQWTIQANQAATTFNFGNGISVQQAAATYIEHYGCFIAISSTPGTFTEGGVGNPISTTANYKTIS